MAERDDIVESTETIARFGRWLMNTGFDGGVDGPPVKAHQLLQEQAAELTRLRTAAEAMAVALEPFAKEWEENEYLCQAHYSNFIDASRALTAYREREGR